MPHTPTMNPSADIPEPKKPRRSTLIEFPGLNRSPVPEWRKELSERVREVQERRAREAAVEVEEAERRQMESEPSVPQLELLPAAEAPTMNPLVVAALRRIERAHQPVMTDDRRGRGRAATAVAYAPSREEPEIEPAVTMPAIEQLDFDTIIPMEDPEPPIEKPRSLVIVPPIETIPENTTPPPAPRRLILDDLNDPALNYLDSISKNVCIDELDHSRASVFRRLLGGLTDLLTCALLTSPVFLAIRLTETNLRDPKTIAVLAGSFVVVMFLYLTLTIALTGRTWAMRLLSLRVIDTKTGLIPTGGQSVGRAFLFLVSLATAGIGFMFALVSRDGYAMHDKFTGTAVIVT